MLDDRIRWWQPGEVDLIGFPWHGLAQGPAHGTTGDFILTLPNGRQINMGPVARNPRTYRYRDVRAVDPVLTTEQQAQATAAGAEWRADALLPIEPGATWMYCDGEEGWRITLEPFTFHTAQRLDIEPMITIGMEQGTPEYRAEFKRKIEIAQLSPRPEFIADDLFTRTLAGVADITPTGNKALIARSAQMGQYNPTWVELWEVELSGPGAAVTATARLIWSFDDLIADYAETDTHPGGIQGYDVAGTAYWTMVSANSDGAFIESAFQFESRPTTIRGFEQPHTRIRTREYKNRVVHAYYVDGEIKQVRLELVARTLRSVDVLTGPTVTPETVGSAFVSKSNFGTGEYNWPPQAQNTTALPRYVVDTSLSGTLESTLEYVLIDDGVEVSRYEATATGSHTYSRTGAFIECGPFNDMRDFDRPNIFLDGADAEGASLAEGSYTVEHVYEGVTINTDSHSESWTNGQTVQFQGYVADVPPPGSIDRKRIWPITEEGDIRVIAFPTQYRSGMPGIMVVTETLNDDPPVIKHRVGAIACRGDPFPGLFFSTDTTAGLELYGAYNAITGERVRDTPGPCYYV